MMNITIFGATGGTGQHLVKQALARGYRVTAFARSPEVLEASGKNLRLVQGDVRQAASVDQAVAGADAVISVLGPSENRPVFAVSEGTAHILEAMKRHGVERLIVSAGAGVSDPNDAPKFINRVMDFLLRLFARWVYEDMARTVEILRNSDVRWTVVRVPMLTGGEPTGEVRAGYIGKGIGARITRADMARFMLDQIEREDYVHKAPVISN